MYSPWHRVLHVLNHVDIGEDGKMYVALLPGLVTITRMVHASLSQNCKVTYPPYW